MNEFLQTRIVYTISKPLITHVDIRLQTDYTLIFHVLYTLCTVFFQLLHQIWNKIIYIHFFQEVYWIFLESGPNSYVMPRIFQVE